MKSNSNSNSNSKSQKVKDIVDVVDENSQLKLFFGNTDDDVDDDDDDDDVQIDHDVSSSASPPLSKKIIILSSLIVISVTLVLHRMTTTTTTTTSVSPPLDTMLNQDMELVGVQAQEQLPGKWCCPRDLDGCTSNFQHNTYCDKEYGKRFKTLPNGTVCKPRIGGHCCADSTSSQYHWQFVWVGHKTGCLKSSF